MYEQSAPIGTLLEGALTPSFSGQPLVSRKGAKVIEATVTGTGAVTASVSIYGNARNNNTDGILLATITLSGSDAARDGFAFDAGWPFLYAVLTAMTGTGASILVDVAA